ncbi:hypothetical protein CC80DRAFT_554836 [Byssothecium circinans]|uniref:Uncharacterized protein n=1 Tax=Byssothecium circinans TaxID=147558 RepID=A0A6A5TGK2_9PLEO|nr:hypothetical protein CC80DRAFT_554836 [Byssothecium circinans]
MSAPDNSQAPSRAHMEQQSTAGGHWARNSIAQSPFLTTPQPAMRPAFQNNPHGRVVNKTTPGMRQAPCSPHIPPYPPMPQAQPIVSSQWSNFGHHANTTTQQNAGPFDIHIDAGHNMHVGDNSARHPINGYQQQQQNGRPTPIAHQLLSAQTPHPGATYMLPAEGSNKRKAGAGDSVSMKRNRIDKTSWANDQSNCPQQPTPDIPSLFHYQRSNMIPPSGGSQGTTPVKNRGDTMVNTPLSMYNAHIVDNHGYNPYSYSYNPYATPYQQGAQFGPIHSNNQPTQPSIGNSTAFQQMVRPSGQQITQNGSAANNGVTGPSYSAFMNPGHGMATPSPHSTPYSTPSVFPGSSPFFGQVSQAGGSPLTEYTPDTPASGSRMNFQETLGTPSRLPTVQFTPFVGPTRGPMTAPHANGNGKRKEVIVNDDEPTTTTPLQMGIAQPNGSENKHQEFIVIDDEPITTSVPQEVSAKPNVDKPQKTPQYFAPSQELLRIEKEFENRNLRAVHDTKFERSSNRGVRVFKDTKAWMAVGRTEKAKPNFSTLPATHLLPNGTYRCHHVGRDHLENCRRRNCVHPCCTVGVTLQQCLAWMTKGEKQFVTEFPDSNYTCVYYKQKKLPADVERALALETAPAAQVPSPQRAPAQVPPPQRAPAQVPLPQPAPTQNYESQASPGQPSPGDKRKADSDEDLEHKPKRQRMVDPEMTHRSGEDDIDDNDERPDLPNSGMELVFEDAEELCRARAAKIRAARQAEKSVESGQGEQEDEGTQNLGVPKTVEEWKRRFGAVCTHRAYPRKPGNNCVRQTCKDLCCKKEASVAAIKRAIQNKLTRGKKAAGASKSTAGGSASVTQPDTTQESTGAALPVEDIQTATQEQQAQIPTDAVDTEDIYSAFMDECDLDDVQEQQVQTPTNVADPDAIYEAFMKNFDEGDAWEEEPADLAVAQGNGRQELKEQSVTANTLPTTSASEHTAGELRIDSAQAENSEDSDDLDDLFEDTENQGDSNLDAHSEDHENEGVAQKDPATMLGNQSSTHTDDQDTTGEEVQSGEVDPTANKSAVIDRGNEAGTVYSNSGDVSCISNSDDLPESDPSDSEESDADDDGSALLWAIHLPPEQRGRPYVPGGYQPGLR